MPKTAALRPRQRLDDVAYTRCVSAGTRDVDVALMAGRQQLSGARTADDFVLST